MRNLFLHDSVVEPMDEKIFLPRVLYKGIRVSPLTMFGLFAVTSMLVCSLLRESQSLVCSGICGICVLGSAYGFLQGAWHFGFVEGVVGYCSPALVANPQRLLKLRRERSPPQSAAS